MSPVLPGYVYFDPKFKYRDYNETGEKLFVILCDSPLDSNLVVVTRTTSQIKTNRIHGCDLENYPPTYYLSSDISNFKLNTWIMIDWVVEYEKKSLEKMRRIIELSLVHTKELLTCASESQYLDYWAKEALKNEADNINA